MATKKKNTGKKSSKKVKPAKQSQPAVPGEMTVDQAQAIVDGNAAGDVVKAREMLKNG